MKVSILKDAGSKLKKNKDIVLAAINNNGCAIYHANYRFKNDRNFVLIAIKNDKYAFNLIEYDVKNDRELILEAIKIHHDISLIKYASSNLLADKDFLEDAIIISGFQQLPI